MYICMPPGNGRKETREINCGSRKNQTNTLTRWSRRRHGKEGSLRYRDALYLKKVPGSDRVERRGGVPGLARPVSGGL